MLWYRCGVRLAVCVAINFLSSTKQGQPQSSLVCSVVISFYGQGCVLCTSGWHLGQSLFGGISCNVFLETIGYGLVLSGWLFRLILGL